MKQEQSLGEYLTHLCLKYDAYTGEFFHALLTARKNRKSDCGTLSIDAGLRQKRKTPF